MSDLSNPFFLIAFFNDGFKTSLGTFYPTQADAERAAARYITDHRPIMPNLKVRSVHVVDLRDTLKTPSGYRDPIYAGDPDHDSHAPRT